MPTASHILTCDELRDVLDVIPAVGVRLLVVLALVCSQAVFATLVDTNLCI